MRIPASNEVQVARIHQGLLVQQLQTIFTEDKPCVNVRKELQLKHSFEDSHPLELDVWLPKSNICFEFQDNYHYVTEWLYQTPAKTVQQRDDNKKSIAHSKGIRLVEIPCWWDGTIDSLKTSIHFYCPDIPLESFAEAIPLNPPFEFFAEADIPEIGELMYASYPLNPKGLSRNAWWIGEKYDGIRCCWSYTERKLYSRYGKEFALLPPFETIAIQPHNLDGEIWFGRGQFSMTHAFVRRAVDLVSWSSLRIIAFDSPSKPLLRKPFETRYSAVLHISAEDHPFIINASRFLLRISQLPQFVQMIIENDGEGVMLRQVGSMYEHGRSPALVKLKNTFDDREGIVIAIQNKAVQLQLPHGIIFTVPPESVYINNLAIGDVVTFSSENQPDRRVPLHPKIIKLRTDVSWKEIVSQFYKDNTQSSARSSQGKRVSNEKMRSFLESYAVKRKRNPLLAETWYSFSEYDITLNKVGKVLVQKFAGYSNAVQNLFPEILFDRWHEYNNEVEWNDVRNRRDFFEQYARQKGFDPLLPENWYSQSFKNLMLQKGASRVIAYHKKSISTALQDLFPEINLDPSRFATAKAAKINKRKFFVKLASENRFDPLKAENWYSQPKNMTNSRERHLSSYNISSSNTIMNAFPDIGFDKSLLQSYAWYNAMNRRRLLENFAEKNKFDPLVPFNWYQQTKSDLTAGKTKEVISYYNGSISNALLDLFPEIGLDKFKCWSLWSTQTTNGREYFEKYALENSFDPLNAENWYMQQRKQIMTTKGIYEVIHPYSNSVSNALTELFPEVEFEKAKFWNSKQTNTKDAQRKLKSMLY